MASVYTSSSEFSNGFQLFSSLLLLLLLMSPVDAKNQSQEVLSLLRFKDTCLSSELDYGFGNDYFITWLETDENPCEWIGVTCTENRTVSEIDLSDWGLDLLLPLNVGMLSNLRDLQYLDLSANFLTSFPVGLDNLTGLTELYLSQNDFDQITANIGKLTRLTLLDLSETHLVAIPPNISTCRSLRSLCLQDNLLSGDLSSPSFSLLGLAELQVLLLGGNYFSGAFPSELKQLSKLVTLDLSRNLFSGSIPALPNLTKLVDLILDNNNFTDFTEPWSLGSNGTLQQLSVSYNQLNGTIPSRIPNLLELRTLNLSGNQLSGAIPPGFAHQVEHRLSMDLSQNQLTGSIPADLLQRSHNRGGCSRSDYFNLSFNLLTGSIPTPPAPVSCISTLDLSHNNLSGHIPQNLFGDGQSASGISIMWLHNNRLSGDIVDVLNQASHYTWAVPSEIRAQRNMFTGDLSKLSYANRSNWLFVLDVSNNDLRWSTSEVNPDPIQSLLISLSTYYRLQEFRAGGNNFSGTFLPSTCFTDPTSYLKALDLSNSQLSGEIFAAAFNSNCLSNLQFFNLSNNNVSGSVPKSIVQLPTLKTLDISDNMLSGKLPNISDFDTILDTNPIYFGGNDGLCGYPLNDCPAPQPRGSGLPTWVLLITIGGSVTVALISCFAATWRWRVYRKRHEQDADLIRTLMDRDAATLMPLRELRRATDNFADSAQIGEGGFGTVYVGKLGDGTTVAIKRSKREGSDKDKEQFLNEVRILSYVNHRHLVKLIGCCMENKVAVLVFEFVSNGTLQEHLQGKLGPVRLTWKQRVNIAVQTADALNYLHSAATIPIYHRDVKSANILLNDDLDAKVADFGISRLAPRQATHLSTVAVQGTMGYIDPEYYTSYQLTDKSDVYSFGVVLLELISAKHALDFSRGGDKTSLVNFASLCIARGDLEELIDPALAENYNDLADPERESILSVGRLAMRCADMRSKRRPNMNEVWKELQRLWLGLNSIATQPESVERDGCWDADRDDRILLTDSISGESSPFTVDSLVDSDSSFIELSQLSYPGCRL